MTKWFSNFALRCSEHIGSAKAFFVSLSLTFIWLVLGPFCHYSDTWQLVCNTFSTIVTTLIVVLIQNTQNSDTKEIKERLARLEDQLTKVVQASCGVKEVGSKNE